MNIAKLLKFTEFTHQFQQIQRKIYATGEKRLENDAEHSFQLALVSWYIVDSQRMKLNLSKVIAYALIHDLVETFTGDSHFLDEKGRKDKEKREAKSAAKIKKMFSEWTEGNKLIENYQCQNDPESKFVWTLDKLIPLLNIHLDSGRTWKRDKTGLSVLIENKQSKTATDPTLNKLFWQWVKLARKNPQLFPKV